MGELEITPTRPNLTRKSPQPTSNPITPKQTRIHNPSLSDPDLWKSKKKIQENPERKEKLYPISVYTNLSHFILHIILIIKVLWAGHDPPNLKKKEMVFQTMVCTFYQVQIYFG